MALNATVNRGGESSQNAFDATDNHNEHSLFLLDGLYRNPHWAFPRRTPTIGGAIRVLLDHNSAAQLHGALHTVYFKGSFLLLRRHFQLDLKSRTEVDVPTSRTRAAIPPMRCEPLSYCRSPPK